MLPQQNEGLRVGGQRQVSRLNWMISLALGVLAINLTGAYFQWRSGRYADLGWLPLMGLGLVIIATLVWVEARSRRARSAPDAVDATDPLFCPPCAKLTEARYRCPGCEGEAHTAFDYPIWGALRRCEHCRPVVHSRADARKRGLQAECRDCAERYGVQREAHPVRVIGVFREADFRTLASYAGGKLLRQDQTRLLFREGTAPDAPRFLFVYLPDLPEHGEPLPAWHPASALTALWIGVDAKPLEVGRDLDALARLLPSKTLQQRRIDFHFWDEQLAPGIAAQVQNRLGQDRTREGVTPTLLLSGDVLAPAPETTPTLVAAVPKLSSPQILAARSSGTE